MASISPSHHLLLLLPLLYYSTASTLPTLTSNSNLSHTHDSIAFNSALHTLLFNLRSTITLVSSRRYSHGEISCNDSINTKLYGVAKCVQSVSSKDCVSCVENATNKLYKCCAAKQGGTVIHNYCMVQFESYKFYASPPETSNAIKEESDIVTYYEDSSKTGNCVGLRKKVIWIWSALVSCFTGVAVGTWLLKRKVVNKAKVAATDEEEG
ncbi:hypothetical protein ACHQM5_006216 [Ranunculus cassubicifolius]